MPPTVQAIQRCIYYTVSRNNMLNVLQLFPDEAERLRNASIRSEIYGNLDLSDIPPPADEVLCCSLHTHVAR